MAKKGKKLRVFIVFLIFVVYFFIAARPIPREVILAPLWVSSLEIPQETSYTQDADFDSLLPFTLGSRFGYVDMSGQFAINKIKSNEIYLSQDMWTEYSVQPYNIEIKNIQNETVININNAGGYPVLLDDRVFILGSEQNSLAEIGEDGNILWTYSFGAPITCMDAAAGLTVTGSLDGFLEIFNSTGERIFNFDPGGSRYTIILGCAVSRDGVYIGIVSGIDQQRFLLLERFGSGEYKVIYHEFLESGFRRPVLISFIDEDRRIVYERAGGIGSYNIRSRRAVFIPLEGEIRAFDNSGDHGYLFLITSHPMRGKKLIGIVFPQERWWMFTRTAASVFIRASFRSDDVFLGRTRSGGHDGSVITAGGGTALISFNLEEN